MPKSPAKLYRYHVKNLRAIESALDEIGRSIRSNVSRMDSSSFSTIARRGVISPDKDKALFSQQCLYALLLGTWAECRLRKILYEPGHFSEVDREKVFSAKTQLDQWKNAVEVAFRKHYQVPRKPLTKSSLPYSAASHYSELIAILNEDLDSIIEVRNKLAHGQWIYPLNSEGNDVSEKLLHALRKENILSLQFKKQLLSYFALIINDLIVSKLTFERDFDSNYRAIVSTRTNLSKRSYKKYVEKMRDKYYRGKLRAQANRQAMVP